MNGLQALTACAGEWRGNNRLQDPHANLADDSPATASVSPVLGGKFVRIDYTWARQDQPHEGSLLIGWEAKAGVASAYWADTWHNGDKVMACTGTVDATGALAVQGSYAAPPGPDWGWRIRIEPQAARALRVVMHNLWPEGRADLAVEIDLAPA